MNLPILYTIEHASHDLGPYKNRIALDEDEILRFSDYGTLDTVPRHTKIIASKFSRALIDLNRHPNHPELYPSYNFSKSKRKKLWKRKDLSKDEKKHIFENIYKKHHEEILTSLKTFKNPGIVIAWHNTAHYHIGKNEEGKKQMMVPFILSNLGDEGSVDSKNNNVSCSPELLTALSTNLSRQLKKNNLPSEIYLNLVFKGGYTTENYNTRRHPELNFPTEVHSLQVEYDTALTHNQRTLEPNFEVIEKIRTSFEGAIEKTYLEIFGSGN